jgi:hypothetical protein
MHDLYTLLAIVISFLLGMTVGIGVYLLGHCIGSGKMCTGKTAIPLDLLAQHFNEILIKNEQDNEK